MQIERIITDMIADRFVAYIYIYICLNIANNGILKGALWPMRAKG